MSSRIVWLRQLTNYLFDKNKALVYHGRIDDNWKDEEAVTREELKEAMNNNSYQYFELRQLNTPIEIHISFGKDASTQMTVGWYVEVNLN